VPYRAGKRWWWSGKTVCWQRALTGKYWLSSTLTAVAGESRDVRILTPPGRQRRVAAWNHGDDGGALRRRRACDHTHAESMLVYGQDCLSEVGSGNTRSPMSVGFEGAAPIRPQQCIVDSVRGNHKRPNSAVHGFCTCCTLWNDVLHRAAGGAGPYLELHGS